MSRRNPIARVLRDLGGGVHQRARSGERHLLEQEVEALIDEWFEESHQRPEDRKELQPKER